ncbi:MAG: sel1 repeat family protein [Acidobacteriia bacterium]|nr:sel1 repeat family protein [Terriglobia bacterium]
MRAASFLLLLVISAVLVSPDLAPAQTKSSPRTAQQMFERGMNLITGTGVNRNDIEAVNYFRRAAEAGYAPAQTVMGYLYETGTMVSSEPQMAAQWYAKSAAQNDRLAQWVLGRMYLSGNGPMRDRNQAMNWLRQAAEAGDPFAALLMGEAEEEIEPGPAVPWYRQAAQQGLPEAQARLGRLLASGRVGAPQKYEAYVWLLVSFENGNSGVGDDLRRIETDLGSTRVEEAKVEARKLRDSTLRAAVAKGCTGWDGELSALPSTPPPKLQAMCR